MAAIVVMDFSEHIILYTEARIASRSIERDAIRASVYKIICSEKSITTIAAICSAEAAYAMPSVSCQDDIYHLTYKTISERFQYYLQDISKKIGGKQYGIIVGDHRGSGEDKRLRAQHQKLIHSNGGFISNYDNLIETLFLEPSNISIGIQLADMVAGAVWRKYERNDGKWYGAVESSFRRSPDGRVDGYGIIKVPKAGWK